MLSNPPDIVTELDSFFEKEWVISLLAKTTFQMRDPQRDNATKDSHIRSERAYLWVQAAFVIEALGDGSTMFSEIRRDPRQEILLESWHELRAWLIARTPALEVVNSIRSAMKAFESLNATIPSTEKRRRWAGYMSREERPNIPPSVQGSSQVPFRPISRKPVAAVTPQFLPRSFPKREGPADRRQSL